MHTITATFSSGRPISRRTDAAYLYASRKTPQSVVRFHKTEEAARTAAGPYGEVVRTDYDSRIVAVAPPTAVEIQMAEDRAAVRRVLRIYGVRSREYEQAEAEYIDRYGRPEERNV